MNAQITEKLLDCCIHPLIFRSWKTTVATARDRH
jgi:hypothetical protein